MNYQQIRNATVKINYAGVTFLVDPWLQDKGKGATAPSPDPDKNKQASPLVDLPCAIYEILSNIDACIITHNHPDHFTEEYLPKDIKLIVQNNEDAIKLNAMGFLNTIAFENNHLKFKDILLTKTAGRHGENEQIAAIMGSICGIIFEHPSEKKLYIVGDSVWYEEIEKNLSEHQPDYVVLNACDARIDGLGRLVMNEEEVSMVYNTIPKATVIISHMDTVNHAFLSREKLTNYLIEEGIMDRIIIPADGEIYSL